MCFVTEAPGAERASADEVGATGERSAQVRREAGGRSLVWQKARR